MSEHARHEFIEAGELSSAEVYRQQFEEQSKHLLELEQRHDILGRAEKLIDAYDIQKSLFDSPERAILFTAIAESSERFNGAETPYTLDLLTTLAHEHSPYLKQYYDEVVPTETDNMMIDAINAYTDKEATTELKNAIDQGLLDGVKAKLGITANNEDPYELRVLSISDDMGMFGLEAPAIDYTLDFNSEEFKSQQADYDDIKNWKKGLEQRTEDFKARAGLENTPVAWVSKIDGKQILCLSTTYAEKILRPESTQNVSYYTESNREEDFALLAHEYTHTQGGLNIDNKTTFGIGLEERRAEYFSGDKHGYGDVKTFLNQLCLVSGFDIRKYFDEHKKGGQASDLYTELANKVGLANMLKIVTVQPRPYLEKATSFMKHANENIGGYDGVLQSVFDTADRAAYGERLDAYTDKLRDMFADKPDMLEFALNHYKNYGLVKITEEIQAAVAVKFEQQKTATV